MSMMGGIKRQIGTNIPSSTENNPQREGKEHVKAIMLQSGKVLKNLEKPNSEGDKENVNNPLKIPSAIDDKVKISKEIPPMVEPEKNSTKDVMVTKIPFPSIIEENKKQDDDKFVSFLNLYKPFNVNLPLIELIEKVPKDAKFLKETMSKRKKIKVGEQVEINTSCNAIISKQIPQKLKDLGSFTFPIKIGNVQFNSYMQFRC